MIKKAISHLRWIGTRITLALRLRYSDVVSSGIEGWMTDEELEWLRETAQGMKRVVEIGSWKGRSTQALLAAEPQQVVAVDYWPGYRGVKRQFLKNVGHNPRLALLEMPSLEAAKLVYAADMVFLDGAHDYASVSADIRAWRTKARRILCGHDYDKNTHPGVVLAVNEAFGHVETVGSIWFVRLGTVNSRF